MNARADNLPHTRKGIKRWGDCIAAIGDGDCGTGEGDCGTHLGEGPRRIIAGQANVPLVYVPIECFQSKVGFLLTRASKFS